MDSGFRRNDGRVGYIRRVRFCGRDCRALLFPGPSRPRRAGAGKVARSAIARRMRASPMSVQGRTVSGPRSLLAKSRGQGCPRDRGREGVLFFGDFLLDKQKKVTRPPGWRTKKHTDVSRFSQQARSVAQGLPSPYPLPQAGEGKSRTRKLRPSRNDETSYEVTRSQNRLTPSSHDVDIGECAAARSPSNVASNCCSRSRCSRVSFTGVSTTT